MLCILSYPAGVELYCKFILYVINMNYTCSILAIAKYTHARKTMLKDDAANTVKMTRHNLGAVRDHLQLMP